MGIFCFQEFGAAGYQESHVRAEQARRAALHGGQQGLHDVSQQAAFGGFLRQGGKLILRSHPLPEQSSLDFFFFSVVLSRRNHQRECSRAK